MNPYQNLSIDELKDLLLHYVPQVEPISKFLSYVIDANTEGFIPTICNLSIQSNTVYRSMTKFLSDKIQNETSFSTFDCFDSPNIKIDRVIKSFLHIPNKSYLFVNPKLAKPGLAKNDFFTIKVLTDNPDSKKIEEYLHTNTTNFSTYYNTINSRVTMSSLKLKESINKVVSANNRVTGTEFISILHTPFIDRPWLESQRITHFQINIQDHKCISGGRPGIPGGIYLTLRCGTCFILFKKTCLIVSSKKAIICKDPLINFLHKFCFDIVLYVQLIIMFIENNSEIVKSQMLPLHCDHNITFPRLCPACVRYLRVTMQKKNLVMDPSDKAKLDFMHDYSTTYHKFKRDYTFLIDLLLYMQDNTVTQSGLVYLNKILSYIRSNDGAVFNQIHIGIFGEGYPHPIDSMVYTGLSPEYKKNVSFFNGHRITFRSLKSSDHAYLVTTLFLKIAKKLQDQKLTITTNILDMTDEEVMYHIKRMKTLQ